MATTHDHEAKEILETLLHRRGEVRLEAEVRPLKSQRADLLFVPHEKRDATLEALGVLDRMTAHACLLEPFSDAPSADDVRECLRKLLNHRHARTLKRPALLAAERSWLLCAGRPTSALDALGCTVMRGWPRGFYELRGLAIALVALPELPLRDDTLALRLLGVGETRARAVDALCEASSGLPARSELIEIVVEFNELRASLTRDATEVSMLDVTRARAMLKRERDEGRDEGRNEGRAAGLRTAIEVYCEALGIALDETQRAWIASANAEELDERLASLRASRAWR